MGKCKKVVGVEEVLHFNSGMLHLLPEEVARLARNLNLCNGVQAEAENAGHDLVIRLVARSDKLMVELEATVADKIRHAIETSLTGAARVREHRDGKAILAFLRS